MSGSGRKTHYRKSVTEEFLHGLPVPEDNEVICRNRSSRGTNIFEIELANGDVELAMLPNKFKKLIWVKRGDFLIVSSSTDSSIDGVDSQAGNDIKVKFLIKNILQKDQILHIDKLGLWPQQFVLDPKMTKKEITKDDLMPDYDSGSDFDYEDHEDEKVDSMGNTILQSNDTEADGA